MYSSLQLLRNRVH